MASNMMIDTVIIKNNGVGIGYTDLKGINKIIHGNINRNTLNSAHVTNVNDGTTSSAYYKLETDVSGSGVGAITTAFTGTFS